MAEESTPEDVEKAVDAIYKYAAALLAEGRTRSQVEEALVEKGIERKTAAIVVDKLIASRSDAGPVVALADTRREEGGRNMMIGGLICVVGIVITIASYSAASEGSGGGRYVVAWGAIIWGAIRFFRGLSQSSG